MVFILTDRNPGNADTLYVVQVSPEVNQDGTVLSEEGAGILIYKVKSSAGTNERLLEVIPKSSGDLATNSAFPQGHKIEDNDPLNLPFTMHIMKRTGNAYYLSMKVKP